LCAEAADVTDELLYQTVFTSLGRCRPLRDIYFLSVFQGQYTSAGENAAIIEIENVNGTVELVYRIERILRGVCADIVPGLVAEHAGGRRRAEKGLNVLAGLFARREFGQGFRQWFITPKMHVFGAGGDEKSRADQNGGPCKEG